MLPTLMQIQLARLTAKYSHPVPRYTSYPSALQFGPHITPTVVEGWLKNLPTTHPVSLYLHLPYCKKLCLYCGCNMKVTHNPAVISSYMGYLLDEIRHTARLLGQRLNVSTVHLGGGTPSYCPPEDLKTLFATLHQHFNILPHAELSLEADPRLLTPETVATLASVGITRASLGVQDTNPAVQAAIGRVQPHATNHAAVANLRAVGIQAINIDVVYGLPLQTSATFTQTIADVLELAPSRLALFGYAHVPWMKKHQLVLEQHPRPNPLERLNLFAAATEQLMAAGYVPVGLDHFAKPDDPLAIAAAHGTLHRNFMGYTSDDAPTLLGFGASSISTFPQGYAQNETDIPAYQTTIAAGSLATVKGLAFTERDTLRAPLIESLICNLHTTLPADVLAEALPKLEPLIADGLATLAESTLRITPQGRPFSRVVAACLDDYLKPTSTRHSQAV
ncbi:MAG: oxygen-independent coproporphyrinogen III oxidase [Alphaproteobacteria bacterium]